MDVEEVVQRLIAQNREQAKEIEELKVKVNTLVAALKHFRDKDAKDDDTINLKPVSPQYTWDEAQRQFRVDL